MGKKRGMDCGTTYAAIAEVDILKGDKKKTFDYELRLCSKDPNKEWEDTIVTRKNSVCKTGQLARKMAGKGDCITYKGFKMLLAEEDKEVLRARGYDDEYTPERVTKIFVDSLLKNCDDKPDFDKLVVGVPEIWFDDRATIDCRTKLKDMIQSLPYVNEVELVSEPACASAFFVHNYKKITKKNYEGRIMIIDYGGGTLDVTLCRVSEKGNNSEVLVEKRCGAGLNAEGFIGKAGLAYLEKIIKLALKESNLKDEEITSSEYFPRAMHDVEDYVILGGNSIRDALEMSKYGDRAILEEEFCEFEWATPIKSVTVTYDMLLNAYDVMIRPVLDDVLVMMQQYMDDAGIEWRNPNCEEFKIALVGGFSNLCLVKEQVMNRMEATQTDKRFTDIIEHETDKQKAVAYGAALIANDIISFKQLAQYHLGIAKTPAECEDDYFFAIHMGDEITFDKPVFFTRSDGEREVFVAESTPAIAFSYTKNPFELCGHSKPKSIYQDKLKPGAHYCIGFSLDRSMIITLHVEEIDPSTLATVNEMKIRMDKLHSTIGNIQSVRSVLK